MEMRSEEPILQSVLLSSVETTLFTPDILLFGCCNTLGAHVLLVTHQAFTIIF